MAGELVLDEPPARFSSSQLTYLEKLAGLLPDQSTLYASHGDGCWDAGLVLRLALRATAHALYTTVESDGADLAQVTAELLRHELLRAFAIPIPRHWDH